MLAIAKRCRPWTEEVELALLCEYCSRLESRRTAYSFEFRTFEPIAVRDKLKLIREGLDDDSLFRLPLAASEEEYKAVVAECMNPSTKNCDAVVDQTDARSPVAPTSIPCSSPSARQQVQNDRLHFHTLPRLLHSHAAPRTSQFIATLEEFAGPENTQKLLVVLRDQAHQGEVRPTT